MKTIYCVIKLFAVVAILLIGCCCVFAIVFFLPKWITIPLMIFGATRK